MADTTITGTAVKSVTSRNIHAGVFAMIESVTLSVTPSASQVMLMLPLHSRVIVLDGWVRGDIASAAGVVSYTMDLAVGLPEDHGLFMEATEIVSGTTLRLNRGLGHVVTLTDSDSFPLMKPLTVTIAVAASASISTTPVFTAMVLLQNS